MYCFERGFVEMKKVLSCLLAAVIVFTFSSTAIAVSADDSEPVYGIITWDDGTQITIQGNVYNSTQTRAANAGSTTYEFAIPASAVPSNGSTTIDSPDSGYSSHVYLTISYAMRNTPTEYKLTGVSGRYTIEDDRVGVWDTELIYGCSGLETPSMKYKSQSVTVEHVGNPFSINTGFSSYITSTYGVMGANLTIEYMMGTRTWTFTLTNNLFDSWSPEIERG